MSCSECSGENVTNYDCNCDNSCPPNTVPGPQGNPGQNGSDGSDGSNGVNAFTSLTASFVQPAVSSNVLASVANSTWLTPGQNVFVQTGGFYTVVATPTTTSVTLQNLGTTANSSPTTVVPNSSKVSAAGYAGPALISPLPIANGGTGQASKIPAFDALAPTTTNGDIIARLSGANTRIAAGSNGQVLQVSGGLPAWGTNAPAAASIVGQVPIANGGTGASTASGALTNLGAPSLIGNNSFTGSQIFDVGFGTFGASNSGIAVLVINSASFRIKDLSNLLSADFFNRTQNGQWKQFAKAYVTASASTYAVVPASNIIPGQGDETVVSTYSATGAQTITLPAGTDGRVVRITDGAGNASTNPITLVRSGSDTILGGTSYVINNSYGAVAFIYVAASTNWVILP